MHVCPFNIHAGFSVLIHPALVQIHFSWSVSFFHLGHFLSVSHLLPLRQKICYHGFILSVMPFRALGSTHSSVSEWDVFLAFSDAGILQLSFSLSCLFSCSTATVHSSVMTSVPVHQSCGGLVPFSEWSHLHSGKILSTKACKYLSERLLFLYLMIDPPVC